MPQVRHVSGCNNERCVFLHEWVGVTMKNMCLSCYMDVTRKKTCVFFILEYSPHTLLVKHMKCSSQVKADERWLEVMKLIRCVS